MKQGMKTPRGMNMIGDIVAKSIKMLKIADPNQSNAANHLYNFKKEREKEIGKNMKERDCRRVWGI